MQKSGMVSFLDKNGLSEKYLLSWSTDELSFERIELFEEDYEYNYLDTSGCELAYYRNSSRERVLGNEKLLKRFLQAKSYTSVFSGTSKQEVNVENGHVVISQTKENTDLCLKYELKMVDGNIKYEMYKTADVTIIINSVENARGINIAPINLNHYDDYSSIDSVILTEDGEADFYSEEYLRSKYPIDHIDQEDFVVLDMDDGLEMCRKRLKEWADADTKFKAVDIESTGLEMDMF